MKIFKNNILILGILISTFQITECIEQLKKTYSFIENKAVQDEILGKIAGLTPSEIKTITSANARNTKKKSVKVKIAKNMTALLSNKAQEAIKNNQILVDILMTPLEQTLLKIAPELQDATSDDYVIFKSIMNTLRTELIHCQDLAQATLNVKAKSTELSEIRSIAIDDALKLLGLFSLKKTGSVEEDVEQFI